MQLPISTSWKAPAAALETWPHMPAVISLKSHLQQDTVQFCFLQERQQNHSPQEHSSDFCIPASMDYGELRNIRIQSVSLWSEEKYEGLTGIMVMCALWEEHEPNLILFKTYTEGKWAWSIQQLTSE